MSHNPFNEQDHPRASGKFTSKVTPAGQRASAPPPPDGTTTPDSKQLLPAHEHADWEAIRCLAEKIESGEELDADDMAVMRSAVLSAAGRIAPRWTAAQLGITDPDIELAVADGSADGSILCCESCACMFRPYDDGGGIYVDRFVTATTSTGELDSIDPGEPSRGVCGADPDCACHQAPHYVPKAG